MENDNPQSKKISKKHKRISFKHKKALLLVVGIILLFGLVFGGWRYYESSRINKEEAELIKKQTDHYQAVKAVEDEALAFTAVGRPDKAIEVYNNAIKDTDDSELIYDYKLRKAVIELNIGNTETALNLLLLLEENYQNEDLAQLIATIYLKLKDYDNAKKYYEKAINLVDTIHIDNTDYYREKISLLEEMKANERN